jgi:hypothetical protein
MLKYFFAKVLRKFFFTFFPKFAKEKVKVLFLHFPSTIQFIIQQDHTVAPYN